jgi:hypothetical protein
VSYVVISPLRTSAGIQPVGKSIFKKLKKALSIKGIKKLATIKNVVGIVASVVAPGIGGVIVNGAITTLDIKKAQDSAKKAKKSGKKEVAAQAQQITDKFDSLKEQYDAQRKRAGLPPSDVKLPDLTNASVAQIQSAFDTIQTGIAETGASFNPSDVSPYTPTVKGKNLTFTLIGGASLLAILIIIHNRKRK